MAKRKAAADSNEADAPSTRANCTWTDDDDAIMLRVLKAEKDSGGQSQNGWKKPVWHKVVAALAAEGKQGNGAPKTADKCADHYQNVSYLLIHDFSILIQMFLVEEGLCRSPSSAQSVWFWVG